jgi:hypothetical protein
MHFCGIEDPSEQKTPAHDYVCRWQGGGSVASTSDNTVIEANRLELFSSWSAVALQAAVYPIWYVVPRTGQAAKIVRLSEHQAASILRTAGACGISNSIQIVVG